MTRAERIQQLLTGTAANRQLVRDEMLLGSNLGIIHQQLLEQEKWLNNHLDELQDGKHGVPAEQPQ